MYKTFLVETFKTSRCELSICSSCSLL